jgi:hypothetical protein
MKLAVGIIAAVCMFILVCNGPARAQEYDVGTIEAISEGNIYVRGNHGHHVLETLGSCLWCEVGVDVIINFKAFTRAELSPYSETVQGRPIRVFVVKDGREEG